MADVNSRACGMFEQTERHKYSPSFVGSRAVQNRLVSPLYKPVLFSKLLHGDDAIANGQARVLALLDAYKEAFKTLAEVNLIWF